MKLDFLFGIFPYIAMGLLVVGTAVRHLLLRKQPNIISSELADAKSLFGGNQLWQISLVLLVGGHAIAIIAPRSVLLWDGSRIRLYLLEGAAFTAGFAALAGWLVVLWRNLKHRGESTITELSDVILVALLFVGLLSGLLMALLDRWGSVWGAMILTPYLKSVLQGKPAATLVTQLPFVARLHTFSLFALVAVLPATRLGTALVAALREILRVSGRLASMSAKSAEAWFKKHNPAPWLWPEED